jgi:hypothetical protein
MKDVDKIDPIKMKVGYGREVCIVLQFLTDHLFTSKGY